MLAPNASITREQQRLNLKEPLSASLVHADVRPPLSADTKRSIIAAALPGDLTQQSRAAKGD